MAEAAVENRPLPVRFFCHKCNIEFEHVLQDYTCPFCSGGFIEQLEDNETTRESSAARTSSARRNSTVDESSDIDMSNLDDSEEFSQGNESSRWANWQPPWNYRDENTPRRDAPQLGLGHDLAFLMYNNQISPLNISGSESRLLQMMQQLTGAVSGGASPLLLVGGGPGDLVVSGEGLDAVMSQLLWQAESDGPPPLGAEAIASLPEVSVTQHQEAQSMQCSVCWEAFVQDEKVRELTCGHLYHQACITPWLSLHATCPICRKSLAPPAPDGGRPATPSGELGTPPGLALLFRACGVPFPHSANPTSTASGQTPPPDTITSTTASVGGPIPSPSASWSATDPASRIIRPVAGMLSLLRSISSPSTASSNNTEQRPRPPPPPSNYDMDLEFD